MSLAAPRGLDDVARRFSEMFLAPEAPRLEPLGKADPPRRVAAVDGSSVTLAGSGELLLVAYRAGAVGLAHGVPVPAQAPETRVALLTRENARETLARELDREGIDTEGLPRLDPSGALDALRTLDEILAAERALATLAPGDLLILDGPLQARAAVPLMDRLVQRAAERGVDLVGVSKSTSLRLGLAPALAACEMAGRAARMATWFAPLAAPPIVRGRVFAAKLSPAEARAFRFDLASTREPAALLASIAALGGHPAYPGYPSPVAMAHNAVLLNEDARARLLAQAHEAALAAGVDPLAWDAAFGDYHDVLELGA